MVYKQFLTGVSVPRRLPTSSPNPPKQVSTGGLIGLWGAYASQSRCIYTIHAYAVSVLLGTSQLRMPLMVRLSPTTRGRLLPTEAQMYLARSQSYFTAYTQVTVDL